MQEIQKHFYKAFGTTLGFSAASLTIVLAYAVTEWARKQIEDAYREAGTPINWETTIIAILIWFGLVALGTIAAHTYSKRT